MSYTREDVIRIIKDGRAKNEVPNLSGFDLSGVNLRGVDLRGVDLRGANLEGVDLQEADLRGAKLKDAKFNGNTKLAGVIVDNDTIQNYCSGIKASSHNYFNKDPFLKQVCVITEEVPQQKRMQAQGLFLVRGNSGGAKEYSAVTRLSGNEEKVWGMQIIAKNGMDMGLAQQQPAPVPQNQQQAAQAAQVLQPQQAPVPGYQKGGYNPVDGYPPLKPAGYQPQQAPAALQYQQGYQQPQYQPQPVMVGPVAGKQQHFKNFMNSHNVNPGNNYASHRVNRVGRELKPAPYMAAENTMLFVGARNHPETFERNGSGLEVIDRGGKVNRGELVVDKEMMDHHRQSFQVFHSDEISAQQMKDFEREKSAGKGSVDQGSVHREEMLRIASRVVSCHMDRIVNNSDGSYCKPPSNEIDVLSVSSPILKRGEPDFARFTNPDGTLKVVDYKQEMMARTKLLLDAAKARGDDVLVVPGVGDFVKDLNDRDKELARKAIAECYKELLETEQYSFTGIVFSTPDKENRQAFESVLSKGEYGGVAVNLSPKEITATVRLLSENPNLKIAVVNPDHPTRPPGNGYKVENGKGANALEEVLFGRALAFGVAVCNAQLNPVVLDERHYTPIKTELPMQPIAQYRNAAPAAQNRADARQLAAGIAHIPGIQVNPGDRIVAKERQDGGVNISFKDETSAQNFANALLKVRIHGQRGDSVPKNVWGVNGDGKDDRNNPVNFEVRLSVEERLILQNNLVMEAKGYYQQPQPAPVAPQYQQQGYQQPRPHPQQYQPQQPAHVAGGGNSIHAKLGREAANMAGMPGGNVHVDIPKDGGNVIFNKLDVGERVKFVQKLEERGVRIESLRRNENGIYTIEVPKAEMAKAFPGIWEERGVGQRPQHGREGVAQVPQPQPAPVAPQNQQQGYQQPRPHPQQYQPQQPAHVAGGGNSIHAKLGREAANMAGMPGGNVHVDIPKDGDNVRFNGLGVKECTQLAYKLDNGLSSINIIGDEKSGYTIEVPKAQMAQAFPGIWEESGVGQRPQHGREGGAQVPQPQQPAQAGYYPQQPQPAPVAPQFLQGGQPQPWLREKRDAFKVPAGAQPAVAPLKRHQVVGHGHGGGATEKLGRIAGDLLAKENILQKGSAVNVQIPKEGNYAFVDFSKLHAGEAARGDYNPVKAAAAAAKELKDRGVKLPDLPPGSRGNHIVAIPKVELDKVLALAGQDMGRNPGHHQPQHGGRGGRH